MPLEEWFDKYQYRIRYDIGESAVRTLSLGEIDIDLSGLALRYGHHTGAPELRAHIADIYPGMSPGGIVVTNGAAEALFNVAAALLNPGDHVVVEHPNYPSNYEAPRSLGCRVDLLSLNFDEGFRPNLDRLKKQVSTKTRLISLTHPNNPTGSVITERELSDVIELAERCGCYLLMDETYRDLVLSGDPVVPAASLSPSVISISSMSKVFGTPGVRIGWLASQDPCLVERVLAVREQVTICNSALGEAIATAVLSQRKAYIETARARIRENLTHLSSWMDQRDELEWIRPEAGVVCFPRIRDGCTSDPEVLYRELAEHRETFVIPGRCFERDNRFFRIGYGGDHAEMVEGLERLRQALSEWEG
jgi:aspartate/methionine/tyrosine aminotransferase